MENNFNDRVWQLRQNFLDSARSKRGRQLLSDPNYRSKHRSSSLAENEFDTGQEVIEIDNYLGYFHTIVLSYLFENSLDEKSLHQLLEKEADVINYPGIELFVNEYNGEVLSRFF